MQKLSYAITMTVFCLTISQLAQGQERQEEEKRQRWNIEVSGALNNYDLWELEASATYQVFRYAGLTLSLWSAYFPNQAGAWTAIRSERVKNHGARWLSAHAQIALCAMIGEHLRVSVGYTCSGFDPYENVRYITVEGQRLDIERHKLMHSASLAVGICF